jgi:hypothetical protein
MVHKHVITNPVRRYAHARKPVHICVTLVFAVCEIMAVIFAHDLAMLHISLTSGITCWEVGVMAVASE